MRKILPHSYLSYSIIQKIILTFSWIYVWKNTKSSFEKMFLFIYFLWCIAKLVYVIIKRKGKGQVIFIIAKVKENYPLNKFYLSAEVEYFDSNYISINCFWTKFKRVYDLFFLTLSNKVEKCLCIWFVCLSVRALTLVNILQMSWYWYMLLILSCYSYLA